MYPPHFVHKSDKLIIFRQELKLKNTKNTDNSKQSNCPLK